MPREIPHPFIKQTHAQSLRNTYFVRHFVEQAYFVCALKHIFLEVGNSFITHFGFETMGGLPTTGRGSMQQTYVRCLHTWKYLETLGNTCKYLYALLAHLEILGSLETACAHDYFW